MERPARLIACPVVYNFSQFHMCVCLSGDKFRKTSHRTFIFAHPVYFRAVRVKLVYEGHRFKVKVAGLKEVHNSFKQQMHACFCLRAV